MAKHADKEQEGSLSGEQPVEEHAGPAEGGGQPPEAQDGQGEDADLKARLEAAEARAAENLDGWQRTQADFINYRRRVERDRELEYQTLKGDVVRKLLPVLDDLERALANRPEGESWGNGVELIARKFHAILEAEGIRRIEAQGQPFDPNFHEAISSEPSETVASGHVIEVVQNGYVLGERVIRPAVVRVAQ